MSNSIQFDIEKNPDGEGYLYAAFVDNEDEVALVADGHTETIKEAFAILASLTERTLA